MGNRSRIRLWTTLLPCLTPLYLAFLYHLTSTVTGGLPPPYIPVTKILLACGRVDNLTSLDKRNWTGDVYSEFYLIEDSQNQKSSTSFPRQRSSSFVQGPYSTVRFSLFAFTYTFPVPAGRYFVRLHFNAVSYSNFGRSNALFSVKAGGFTLLSNFNASLTADADDDPEDTIFREYCVNIEKDQRYLNITIIPDAPNAYAFINGIEILSMPPDLYKVSSAKKTFSSSDDYQQNLTNHNPTAMEMVYRLNVGGASISASADSNGMFRRWSDDYKYFSSSSEYKEDLDKDLRHFLPLNTTIELNFTKVPPYTAPKDVYRTARTMGMDKSINKRYNLTWEFPVDSGFVYLVRLHFCEFQPEVTQVNDRVFQIFIANKIAEEAADVINWSGGNGFPIYRDYAVSMFGKEGEKKMNLSLALKANPQGWKTSYSDAILNGVEIFKVSSSNRSLAGSNPDPIVVPPTPSKNNITKIVAVVGGGVSGFVLLSIVGFLILRQRNRVEHSGFSDGTTWWGPFSFSTNKSTKTRMSSLPSDQCRHFSLAKIRAATNNFDEVLIIGVGGFGNVYKGYIKIDGEANPVAIKRLTPGSQQGAHEFKTEIEMLSQLRHRHLVSLIGYCNDGNEMILVYDFMARGTLRDHLHKTTNNPPICWKQRLEICIGAARGLNYLHTGANHTIIHRDVKTTNILLDEKWVAKVSDFGLSKIGNSGAHVSTNVKGTFGYLDPEYYRRQQLSQKSDVYSFGVVLFEVLSAKPPIISTEEMQVVCLAEWAPECYLNGKADQIVDPSLKDEITAECLKTFAEIAINCLHDKGINRPSMNDVVRDLELALQLQETADKAAELEEEIVQPNDMCSGSSRISGQDFSEIVNLRGR